MKARFKKLFLLAIILSTPNLVNAASACSYSEQAEMNNIVANVNASHEATDIYGGKTLDIDNVDEFGNIPEIDFYVKGFKIDILNITEDIYVKVRNDHDSSVLTFYYKDTNEGIATFQTKNSDALITYTVEIYSNKYSCVGEKFREFTFTTPMYNDYSQLQVCTDYPEFYYCQEFISSENVGWDTFYSNLEKYKEEKVKKEQEEAKNKSIIERIKDFYKQNAIVINSVGIVIVVIMGAATTVILIKKKRSRVL